MLEGSRFTVAVGLKLFKLVRFQADDLELLQRLFDLLNCQTVIATQAARA